jgi:hypothetical protein
MDEMPASRALARWLAENGHELSNAPEAFFHEGSGRPREVKPGDVPDPADEPVNL